MRLIAVAMGLIAALSCSPALAQEPPPPPEVLNQVYACRDVAGDAERLACYDRAVGALRQAEQSGEIVAVDRERAETVERESFGFQIPSLGNLLPNFGGEQTPDIQLTVDRVAQRSNGRYAFYMTNGQVWSQVERESASNVRAGTNVTIRRAMAGSFLMSSERGGSAHRVRREE